MDPYTPLTKTTPRWTAFTVSLAVEFPSGWQPARQSSWVLFEEIVIHQFKGLKIYIHPWSLTWLTGKSPFSIGNKSTHSWWMFHCHVSFRGISINKGSFTRYRDSYSWICDASDATGKKWSKIWSSLKMVGCFRMIFIPWDQMEFSSRTKSPTKTHPGKLATDIYEKFCSPSGAERIQGWFQSFDESSFTYLEDGLPGLVGTPSLMYKPWMAIWKGNIAPSLGDLWSSWLLATY